MAVAFWLNSATSAAANAKLCQIGAIVFLVAAAVAAKIVFAFSIIQKTVVNFVSKLAG